METDILIRHEHRQCIPSTHQNGLVNGNHVTYDSLDDKCNNRPLEPRTGIQVYRIRWYILLVFSLTTTLQHAAWDTWGPIAQSSKASYNWTDSILTAMINCGNAGAVVGLIPAAYLVNVKGLRAAMILCTTFLTVGCAIRAVSMRHVTATVFIGVGQFCIGIAGSVTTVLPSVISEAWFPCNERTTATAIGIISNAIGGIVAFLLALDIHDIQRETRQLLYIESIWGAILFLLTLVYFPSKPNRHPSESAAIKRLPFKTGFFEILRKPHAVLVALICAVTWGCFGNWLGLLDVIFHQTGVCQTEAGWYGVYAFTSGTIAGILMGRLIDVVRKHHKLVLLLLFISGFLIIIWITAISTGYIDSTNALSGAAVSLLSVSMHSSMPILFETACEIAYPAGEEMVGLFIGMAKNLTAVSMLLIGFIPHAGTQWLNWTMLSVIGLCIPSLACLRITYSRIDIDSS